MNRAKRRCLLLWEHVYFEIIARQKKGTLEKTCVEKVRFHKSVTIPEQ